MADSAPVYRCSNPGCPYSGPKLSFYAEQACSCLPSAKCPQCGAHCEEIGREDYPLHRAMDNPPITSEDAVIFAKINPFFWKMVLRMLDAEVPGIPEFLAYRTQLIQQGEEHRVWQTLGELQRKSRMAQAEEVVGALGVPVDIRELRKAIAGMTEFGWFLGESATSAEFDRYRVLVAQFAER